MVDNLRKEVKSLIMLLPLAIVSVLVVLLMGEAGVVGSGGLFKSPISPLRISPTPSPVREETVGPATLPPLIGVRARPNYWPWVLGGLVIIGGAVGVMLYRRRRGDEG